jgi:hypothetical protein
MITNTIRFITQSGPATRGDPSEVAQSIMFTPGTGTARQFTASAVLRNEVPQPFHRVAHRERGGV